MNKENMMESNRNDNVKTSGGITITMNIEATRGAQPPSNDSGESKRHGGQDEHDMCLHKCVGGPITVSIPAQGDDACLIQIQTCPAYYRLYKVDRNGVESTLCSGRRGTVYGVMRKVNEELSKNKK